jgi:hypothetical protein
MKDKVSTRNESTRSERSNKATILSAILPATQLLQMAADLAVAEVDLGSATANDGGWHTSLQIAVAVAGVVWLDVDCR